MIQSIKGLNTYHLNEDGSQFHTNHLLPILGTHGIITKLKFDFTSQANFKINLKIR